MNKPNYCIGVKKESVNLWLQEPFTDMQDEELNISKDVLILYIDRNVFLKSYFNRPSKYFQKLLRKIYE